MKIEEQKDELPFPENIQYDINIGELSFDYFRAFQTLTIILVVDILVFAILQLTTLRATYKIVILIIATVGSGLFGITGINGDSVFGYIYNKIIFLKNKRVCYYNPRVKSEIKFFINSDGEKDFIAPRDKIEEMYRKFISKTDIKSAQENLTQNELDISYMYFEDDIALNKPIELMSKRELKKYKKRLAKEEKEHLKQDRKIKKGLNNGKKEQKEKERKVAGL